MGYGTVAKLSGKRRKPYIIKKVSGWNDKGQPIYTIIGYAATRTEGNLLLAEYNKNPWDVATAKMTLSELFRLWKEKEAALMKERRRTGLCSAYKYLEPYKHMTYKEIRAHIMQDTINTCGHGAGTQKNIQGLWRHLDKYALSLGIVEHQYSQLLKAEQPPVTTRDRFSEQDMQTFWTHTENRMVQAVLFLCYSGWRADEFLSLRREDIDTTEWTATGGNKTIAGRGRTVPIHPYVLPFVKAWLSEGGTHLFSSPVTGKKTNYKRFLSDWKSALSELGISEDKTPHWARHTMESMLADVQIDIKRRNMIMGHKDNDIGDRVYNHKSLQDIKQAILLVTKK